MGFVRLSLVFALPTPPATRHWLKSKLLRASQALLFRFSGSKHLTFNPRDLVEGQQIDQVGAVGQVRLSAGYLHRFPDDSSRIHSSLRTANSGGSRGRPFV